MPSSQADTVAIPWFNNIWFNNVAARAPAPSPRPPPEEQSATPPASPSQGTGAERAARRPRTRGLDGEDKGGTIAQVATQAQSVTSSRQTISTLSAVDRISLISLLSTGRASASDVLRTLSEMVERTDSRRPVSVQLVPIRSAPLIRSVPRRRGSKSGGLGSGRASAVALAVRRVASTPCHAVRVTKPSRQVLTDGS